MYKWLAAHLPKKLVFACFLYVVADSVRIQTRVKAHASTAGFLPSITAKPIVPPFTDDTVRDVITDWEWRYGKDPKYEL